jgi:hypothetical protein
MPFTTGNPGGPGRPRKSVEEKYLRKLAASVSLSDWGEIVVKAIADAKRGDAPARKWLSDYLMGTPIQKLEHTGADGGALVIRWTDTEVED